MCESIKDSGKTTHSHRLLTFTISSPLVKSAYQKIIFLISTKTYVVGDGSFEHTKHTLKLMGKKIFTIVR